MKTTIHTSTWRQPFTWMISIAVIICACGTALLFTDKLVPTPLILSGVLVAIMYFYFTRRLSKSWLRLSETQFSRQLLAWALVSRIISTFLLYGFYLWQTGEPFEYHAVDSKFYHETGMLVAAHFRHLDFNVSEYLSGMGFSDRGYNIYLGCIYALFGNSLLVARLFNALFSAFTVWLIYKLAENTTRHSTVARLAGIMAMLLPNFLLYLGTHLKEPLMLFNVTASLYLITQLFLRPQHRALTIGLLLLLLFTLFMFRTVLAVTVVVSFLVYGFQVGKRRNGMLFGSLTVMVMLAFAYMIYQSPVATEIGEYIEKYSTAQSDNMEFRANREGGNKYALIAGAPLFLSVILIAPFPSMVYVPEQDLLWLFIGPNFIRNFLGLFVIAGIVHLSRFRFRDASILLAFLGSYLLILANSGFAISERFHLPAVPVLLILAATGIVTNAKRLQKYYPYYLSLICVLVLAWNYIKLTGRL